MFTNQDPDTREIMANIRAARVHYGDTYTSLTTKINELMNHEHYVITAAEYRACEKGLTRRVSLWLIMAVAHIYQMPADRLFTTLGEY